MSGDTLLQVEEVSKRFRVGGKVLRAVERVSFSLKTGETVGLVGESGSGKSTLGRVVLRLLEADEGRVTFQGQDLKTLSARELRAKRKHMQIIFQDPLASLNPRMTTGQAIGDAMRIQGITSKIQRERKVSELLDRVGLPRPTIHAFPFELSGGQQQRVGIARALAVDPKLMVCDEPLSALDVSIQVQIIDLLRDLQRDMNLSYMFISHNLGVVQYMCNRVMVLYLGEVVEEGSTKEVFEHPQHPYTRVLIESVLKIPESSAGRRLLNASPGEIPSPFSPPSGCPFHPRCGLAESRCTVDKPVLREIGPDHSSACHVSHRERFG